MKFSGEQIFISFVRRSKDEKEATKNFVGQQHKSGLT
jgi:hypothetical protein